MKLAFFYEDFASKDWPEAEQNAKRSYEYFLANVDPEDVAVLTRLANLCLRENMPQDAISVFDRVVALDAASVPAWFNKVHAQMKVKDFAGARESLLRVAQLEPSMPAAQHMLKALDEEAAKAASTADGRYVKDLFDQYAPTYDAHAKKLIYATPRIIRQELSAIYKKRYAKIDAFGNAVIDETKIQQLRKKVSSDSAAADAAKESSSPVIETADGCESNTDTSFVAAAADAPVTSSCTSYTSFMNHTMDVLDMGCGTGQVGGWLKDYAASLTGVDMSAGMVAVARKKGLYQNLHELSLADYFDGVNTLQPTGQRSQMFDIVTAADVLAYVGDLSDTFQNVSFNLICIVSFYLLLHVPSLRL